MRIDPPVSLPMVPKAECAVSATPEPMLLPPGNLLRSQGAARRWFAAAACEFVAARFTDQDGAGRVQLLHDRRIEVRHKAFQHFGPHFGQDAFGIAIVFDADRDAVQGTAIAPGGDFPVGALSGRQRQVRGHRGVGLHRRLGLFDARERGLGKRHRRRFALPQGGRRVADGQID